MPPREEAVAFSHAITLLVAVAGAGGALALALTTSDPVMTFHGLLFFVFFAAGGYYIATHPRRGGKDEQDSYMDGPIKVATIAAVFWGVVGFLVGDVIAWQLAFPALNLDLPWTNFGRLRPLHTSAVIFAFGGNVLLATSFYVVQRTCRARLAGYWAPWFVIWGYQLFIVLAGLGLRARRHRGQGVRRARVVRRPLADDRLGRLPARLPRHAVEAQGAAHLRGELVLPRLHRHHRHAARRQQPGGAGLAARHEELLGCSRACRMR